MSKPPANVALTGGAELTLADDPQKGKVLCIKPAGNGYPGLTYTVDINKARGGTLKFSVSGKCPGEIPLIADKPWAKPKLILVAKDKTGKDEYAGGHLNGGKPEWSDLSGSFVVREDIVSVQIALRVELVAAETYFDGLKIELEGGGAPAPAATTTPAKAGTKAPAKTDAATPIAKSPKKTFEDGGMLFGPEIAEGVKKSLKPGATAMTVLFVGPGLPFKEKEVDNYKPPGKWQLIPTPKELTGPAATPSYLLAHLPGFVGKNRPEVIVFFPETTGTRKPTQDERYDWEDLSRACRRMGAIPVFGVQASGSQEELRKELFDAVGFSGSPAIDLKAPSTVGKRISHILDLFDRHIFERTPLDAPVAGVTKQPDEE